MILVWTNNAFYVSKAFKTTILWSGVLLIIVSDYILLTSIFERVCFY